MANMQMTNEGKGAKEEKKSGPVTSVVSYPSLPITIFDIPEVQDLECVFQYNFFTRDERVSSRGDVITLSPTTMSDFEMRMLAMTREIPRFNKISFVAPVIAPPTKRQQDGFSEVGISYEDEMIYITNAYGQEERISILRNIADVMYEEAITNASFSSIHIHDTGLDQKFYFLLKESEEIFSPTSLQRVVFNTEGAQRYYADKSFANTHDDGTLGEQVTEALSNIQASGARVSSADVREELVMETLFGPRSVEIDFNVNNLYAYTLLRASADEHMSVYEDELTSLLPETRQIQGEAIQSASPGKIAAGEYLHGIIPIDQIGPMPSLESTPLGRYNEASVLIGYIIEKSEVTEEGKVIYHDPIVVENPDHTVVTDSSVMYGGAYQYRVRAVTVTQFEALQLNSDGTKSRGVVVARVLVSSRGKTCAIVATENIPPPPPDEINFDYLYESEDLIFSWGLPNNPQRDIKKFQIFRRKNISQPFQLLEEYDFDDSLIKTSNPEMIHPSLVRKMRYAATFYLDKEFHKEAAYIYAVCAIDAHGLSSNYSEQFLVSFDVFKNRLQKGYISQPGAPKPYPNLYLNMDLFVDTMKDSGHNRMTIFFDPEYLEVYDENDNKLELIYADCDNPSYVMSIINTDLLESEILNITICEKRNRRTQLPDVSSGAEIKTLTLDPSEFTYKAYGGVGGSAATGKAGAGSDYLDGLKEGKMPGGSGVPGGGTKSKTVGLAGKI